jgi:hypothetical protein
MLKYSLVGVPLTQLPIRQVPQVAPGVFLRYKMWWSAEPKGYPVTRLWERPFRSPRRAGRVAGNVP